MKKITQKNISDFYKGKNVAKNIIDLIQKKENSNKDINDFIDNNSFSSASLGNITNQEYVSSTVSKYNRAEKAEGEAVLVKKIKQKQLHRRIKLVGYSILSTASVLAAITFVLRNDTESNYSIKSDIIVTVPTLKLDDGTDINLNNNTEIIANNDIIESKGEGKISLKKSNKISYNTIIIPAKFTYNIILEDSTEVFLNANSEFKYPSHFDSTTREVSLKGEGYFKVTKNKRPFIVNTNTMSVRVYGTEFNINTNSRDVTEALLVSGSVGVTIKGSNQEVKMVPNQLFRMNTTTLSNELSEVEPQNYLGWLVGRFINDNEPLYVLLDKIALWYNVEFEYANKDVLNTVVVVSLNRSSNIDSILKVISKISNVKFIKSSSNKYVVE